MPRTNALKDYLERTLGGPVEFAAAKLAGLPVYLVHAYRPWRTRLFDREFLFAEARSAGDSTRDRLAADLDALRRAAPDRHVALVLPHLTRAQRTRLVAAGIPFIVPGRQMYIPTVLIDLREQFPRGPAGRPKRLSAAAQLVVIRHLLWRDVEGNPLVQLARANGYTAMTLTNVRDELVAADLCAANAGGRTKPLRFAATGRQLWERALPLLRTPVKQTMDIGVNTRHLQVLDAGLTALARGTMLGAPRVRTVAAGSRALRQALAARTALGGAADDESATQVEEWAYDPLRLAAGDVVDPLSLWLSLRDQTDERVRAALDDLLESVQW